MTNKCTVHCIVVVQGLLTIDNTGVAHQSTTQESYPPKHLQFNHSLGDRETLLRQQLCEAIAVQLEKEAKEEELPLASTTHSDFVTDGNKK